MPFYGGALGFQLESGERSTAPIRPLSSYTSVYANSGMMCDRTSSRSTPQSLHSPTELLFAIRPRRQPS